MGRRQPGSRAWPISLPTALISMADPMVWGSSNDTDHCTGHTRGQGSGNNRAESQGNDLRGENEAGFAALLDGPTEYETYNLGLQP